MVSKNAAPPQDEVAVVAPNWAAVDSWDAAVGTFEAIIPAAVAFGDGSVLIENKELLVAKEFLVLDWRYVVDALTQREYVNVLIIGRDGGKARFNDGSTGVYEQCKRYEHETGRRGGIHCGRGLRFSDYVTEVNGKPQAARTYYFSN